MSVRSRAPLFAGLLLALVACGKDSQTPSGNSGKTFVIGFSQCSGDEPWREQMDRDLRAAVAEHPEFELLYRDAQSDSTAQQAHVREYMTQGVDAIVISPLDVSLTAVVEEAFLAGIPVVVLDRKVEGEHYTSFIGADNRRIGQAVGEWVVGKLAGKEANVVELRGLGSSTPAIDRSEPFLETLQGTKIKVVYTADMEWKGDIAREKMQAALAVSSKPNSIDLVYGANDPAAIQAWYAAKDAGREEEMLFVGVDALPHEGIQAVKDGILDATFLYPTGAKEAVEVVGRILRGEPVEKTITLGTCRYTATDVEAGGTPIGGR